MNLSEENDREELLETKNNSSLPGSEQAREQEDAEPICRYCYEIASPGKLLYHPCWCSGSIKYVHKDCLVQWIISSGKPKCTTCRHKFSFVKVYSLEMPESIGIRHVVSEILSRISSFIEIFIPDTHALEFFLCILVIPALIIGRLRADFHDASTFTILNFLLNFMSLQNLFWDAFNGVVFVFLIGIVVSIGYLAKYQSENDGRWPEWLKPDNAIETLKHSWNYWQVDDEEDQNVVGDMRQVQAQWRRVEFWKLDFFGKYIYISLFFPYLRVILHSSVGFCIGIIIVLVFDIFPFTIGNQILGKIIGDLNFIEPLKYFLPLYTGYCVIGFGIPLLRYFPFNDINKTRLEYAIIFNKVALVNFFSSYIFYGISAWWMYYCSLYLIQIVDSEIIPNVWTYSCWKLIVYYQIAYNFAIYATDCIESVKTALGYENEFLNFRIKITEARILPIFKIVQRFGVRLIFIGVFTWVAFWIPSLILANLFPSFLPYRINIGFSWSEILQYIGMLQMYLMFRSRVQATCNAFVQWCLSVILSLNSSEIWKSLLMTMMFCGSIVSVNLLFLALPVYLGRVYLTESLDDVQNGRCGLVLLWLIVKTSQKAIEIFQTNNLDGYTRSRELLSMIFKTVIVVVLLAGVFPLTIGFGLERYILYPGRFMSFDPKVKSELIYWNIGSSFIHTIINISFMSPNTFRIVTLPFLAICFNGPMAVNLGSLLRLILIKIGTVVWGPYVMSYVTQFILWLFGVEAESIVIQRLVFPGVLLLGTPIAMYFIVSGLFKTGQDVVRNRYLLGDNLMNLESNSPERFVRQESG